MLFSKSAYFWVYIDENTSLLSFGFRIIYICVKHTSLDLGGHGWQKVIEAEKINFGTNDVTTANKTMPLELRLILGTREEYWYFMVF